MMCKYFSKLTIIYGDLNVAHNKIDLKNPKTNLRTACYTIEERESFNKILLNNNLLDTFRHLYPTEILYSYWSYMRKSRVKNLGWRIDYFLIDKKLKKKFKENGILTNVLGSDHVPVILLLYMFH
jgi:exodeoxyribonuclease-3